MADRFALVASTLAAELAKPYVYGEADCFFLGCRIADALDPSLGLVERYWRAYLSLAGAQRTLRRRGFASLDGLWAMHLKRCAPAEARFGDLVILEYDGGQHVGVCLGIRIATKTEAGRVDRALDAAVAAFRTGAPA